jgi:hypothetical protein
MAWHLQKPAQEQQFSKYPVLTEQTMEYAMTRETLKTENQVHWGTGGRSEETVPAVSPCVRIRKPAASIRPASPMVGQPRSTCSMVFPMK